MLKKVHEETHVLDVSTSLYFTYIYIYISVHAYVYIYIHTPCVHICKCIPFIKNI